MNELTSSSIKSSFDKIKFSVSRIQGKQGLKLEVHNKGIISIINVNDTISSTFPISEIAMMQDTKHNSLNLNVNIKGDTKSYSFKFIDSIQKYLFKTMVYNHMVT